mmetsp:Transcript_3495/g.10573  ORF Transcript_3495/g.10573 Transcript_3495/m.10573 type:complete len:327 (+) Transcript_3495:29-1009(+)
MSRGASTRENTRRALAEFELIGPVHIWEKKLTEVHHVKVKKWMRLDKRATPKPPPPRELEEEKKEESLGEPGVPATEKMDTAGDPAPAAPEAKVSEEAVGERMDVDASNEPPEKSEGRKPSEKASDSVDSTAMDTSEGAIRGAATGPVDIARASAEKTQENASTGADGPTDGATPLERKSGEEGAEVGGSMDSAGVSTQPQQAEATDASGNVQPDNAAAAAPAQEATGGADRAEGVRGESGVVADLSHPAEGLPGAEKEPTGAERPTEGKPEEGRWQEPAGADTAELKQQVPEESPVNGSDFGLPADDAIADEDAAGALSGNAAAT